MKESNIIFRISSEMKDKFAAKCKSENKTVSECLNGLISSYLGVDSDYTPTPPKEDKKPSKRHLKPSGRSNAKESNQRINLSDFGI